MKTGIIIGRFQTPYLHIGHLKLIAEALRLTDKVVILIGTTTKERDDRNPYGPIEVEQTINKIFPQVQCRTLFDQDTDEVWSKIVDAIIEGYPNPVLFHSRDSFSSHYKGIYPLHEVEEVPGISATKIREQHSIH